MAQDRPEEFRLYRLNPPKRGEATDDFERRRSDNVVALLAVFALVLICYWVIHALGHSRRFPALPRLRPSQFVNPAK
jgi:hypothetical protein